MKILLLGGQSPRHYDWVREVREVLEEAGNEVVLHDYAHWLRDEPTIDFMAELNAVSTIAQEIEGDYIIVAKSIGTVLTAVGTMRGLLAPKACLLLGFPLQSFKDDEDVATAIGALPLSIFVQNTDDPLGSYDELTDYLRPLAPATTVTVPLPGKTHDYMDFMLIAELVAKLSAVAGK